MECLYSGLNIANQCYSLYIFLPGMIFSLWAHKSASARVKIGNDLALKELIYHDDFQYRPRLKTMLIGNSDVEIED